MSISSDLSKSFVNSKHTSFKLSTTLNSLNENLIFPLSSLYVSKTVITISISNLTERYICSKISFWVSLIPPNIPCKNNSMALLWAIIGFFKSWTNIARKLFLRSSKSTSSSMYLAKTAIFSTSPFELNDGTLTKRNQCLSLFINSTSSVEIKISLFCIIFFSISWKISSPISRFKEPSSSKSLNCLL